MIETGNNFYTVYIYLMYRSYIFYIINSLMSLLLFSPNFVSVNLKVFYFAILISVIPYVLWYSQIMLELLKKQ